MKRTAFILIILAGFFTINATASKKTPKSAAPKVRSAISGVLLDKTTKEALAGVAIRLSADSKLIYSDSNGEFTMPDLEPGTYKMKINCISYTDKEVTVKVSRTPADKVKILLSPIEP
jgi:hypothetical protein